MLLKTSGEDSADDLKGLIHQANVRADVVVELIQELKDRGHRAYRGLDMTLVRQKAKKTLPDNDVPPEILHFLKIGHTDQSLDKVKIQKAATAIPGRSQTAQEVASEFDAAAPNAVVCERSVEDGCDVVAQRTAAIQAIGAQLSGAPLRKQLYFYA